MRNKMMYKHMLDPGLLSLINKVKDDRQALNDIIQELDLSTNDAINQEKAKIKQYLYETLK